MRPLSHFEFLLFLLVITLLFYFFFNWLGEGEEGASSNFFPAPSAFAPLLLSPSQKKNILSFTER